MLNHNVTLQALEHYMLYRVMVVMWWCHVVALELYSSVQEIAKGCNDTVVSEARVFA